MIQELADDDAADLIGEVEPHEQHRIQRGFGHIDSDTRRHDRHSFFSSTTGMTISYM